MALFYFYVSLTNSEETQSVYELIVRFYAVGADESATNTEKATPSKYPFVAIMWSSIYELIVRFYNLGAGNILLNILKCPSLYLSQTLKFRTTS